MKYLSRTDIAEALRVTPQQAGRLMLQMPYLQYTPNGKKLVEERAFEAWCREHTVYPVKKVRRRA